MKAALLTAPEKIEIADIPKPTPGPEEIQVKVKCVAICGTDVHIYQGFPIGIFHPKLPLILGHEFSATVSALGKNVKGFRKGDRVTVEANIGCGKCYLCRTGAYGLCPDVKVLSIHANGGLAEYVVAPQTHVYHLPDSYDDEVASLTEPLAMAMCGYLRAPVMPGDFVAVLGAGTGGFCLAALAKMAGAEKVIDRGLTIFNEAKHHVRALHFGARLNRHRYKATGLGFHANIDKLAIACPVDFIVAICIAPGIFARADNAIGYPVCFGWR